MSGERLAKVLAHLAGEAAARGVATSCEAACEACVSLIGVTGAQLTLMNGTGRGESRYATNDIGAQLENLRFTLGEGPCEDSIRSGTPVLAGDLDSWDNDQRWPLYVRAAVAVGARAVFVFPLRSGAIRIGALVLHRTSPGPLTQEQILDAHVVADVIMSLLLDELTIAHLDAEVLPPDGMPLSRAEVHQATGMLSVQMGVSLDEALVRLRAHAFAHDQPVVDVARDIVGRRLRLRPESRSDPR
ncbi:GAF and ANTAR domain-containing protein [Lentzea sp. BCCO 10_0061]|uniref:GAF and ANTAR domain-containing protein n=1 Tax=Lentzea sokolovensis TaxID=3095429 RepID=A0ABU4USU9_9PSEU|nr:GAF and ANTAR domain-containing protein [Lentzea sp. BCCO 10_0061]MDX8141873.1 GAF and ANTAR domain-containing protein [Lentzea sp. BCCO 10_0061]